MLGICRTHDDMYENDQSEGRKLTWETMCCYCVSGVTHYKKKMTLTLWYHGGSLDGNGVQTGQVSQTPGYCTQRHACCQDLTRAGSAVDSEPLFLPQESCLPHPGPVPEWRPKNLCLLCCGYGPLRFALSGLDAGSGLVSEEQPEVTRNTRG